MSAALLDTHTLLWLRRHAKTTPHFVGWVYPGVLTHRLSTRAGKMVEYTRVHPPYMTTNKILQITFRKRK